jgi:predicted negative regulator of RcsB-dependent stress response
MFRTALRRLGPTLGVVIWARISRSKQASAGFPVGSGPDEHAAAEAVRLGDRLSEQGDVAGARAAYQQAIDSGHPDVAPWAMVYLGNLLVHYLNPAGARASYQMAAESGHPEAARRAASRLAALDDAR